MPIQNHKVVTMHYHLTDTSGQVLESSRDSDPLTYLHGVGNILPALERALVGLDVGATTTVHLEPDEAYGAHDDDQVETVPRSELAGIDNLHVGMQLEAHDADGNTLTVLVAEIDDETVVLDGNHPLAGIALTFAIDILDVRDATAGELTHGHAHGEAEPPH